MDKYPDKIRSGSHKTVHACKFLTYYALSACGANVVNGEPTEDPVTCKRCLERIAKEGCTRNETT